MPFTHHSSRLITSPLHFAPAMNVDAQPSKESLASAGAEVRRQPTNAKANDRPAVSNPALQIPRAVRAVFHRILLLSCTKKSITRRSNKSTEKSLTSQNNRYAEQSQVLFYTFRGYTQPDQVPPTNSNLARVVTHPAAALPIPICPRTSRTIARLTVQSNPTPRKTALMPTYCQRTPRSYPPKPIRRGSIAT